MQRCVSVHLVVCWGHSLPIRVPWYSRESPFWMEILWLWVIEECSHSTIQPYFLWSPVAILDLHLKPQVLKPYSLWFDLKEVPSVGNYSDCFISFVEQLFARNKGWHLENVNLFSTSAIPLPCLESAEYIRRDSCPHFTSQKLLISPHCGTLALYSKHHAYRVKQVVVYDIFLLLFIWGKISSKSLSKVQSNWK